VTSQQPETGAQDDEYAAAVALWHALGDDGRRTVLRMLLRLRELGPATAQDETLDGV